MKKIIGLILAGVIGLLSVSAYAETPGEKFANCMIAKCSDQVDTCFATEGCKEVIQCTLGCDTLECVKTKCVPMVKTEAQRLAVVGFLKCRAAYCSQ